MEQSEELIEGQSHLDYTAIPPWDDVSGCSYRNMRRGSQHISVLVCT